MAQFTWTFDAPTGTFKQNALSRKLYEASLADAVFMDHVSTVDGFGRKQGENVTLTIVKQLTEPSSGKLTEGVRIPEDTLALTTTSITVSEYGRSVPYNSLADDLSFFDLENEIQVMLRYQMKLTLDTAAATQFKNAKVKYVPTGLAANNITTNGTAGAQATANMTIFHCEEIRDYMYDTLFVPPVSGGMTGDGGEGSTYTGIFRTLALRGIKRDPAWEEWQKYTNPQAKYNSEVGKIEEIRFIECNHSKALSKIGLSSVLGEGVVFGDQAVAMAEVLTPELRAAIPGDFGRAKAVAWYGILEFGTIFATGNAGEAKVVHVTST